MSGWLIGHYQAHVFPNEIMLQTPAGEKKYAPVESYLIENMRRENCERALRAVRDTVRAMRSRKTPPVRFIELNLDDIETWAEILERNIQDFSQSEEISQGRG